MIPDIRHGRKIRTRDQLAMAQAVQSAGVGDAGGLDLERSARGTRINSRAATRIAVFEITRYWEWTSNDSLPEGAAARPQHFHRARAKPVVYFSGSTQRKWDSTALRREEWIYHHVGYCPLTGIDDPPTAIRYQQREANAMMPRSGVGDWVWCQFDQQSGMWESIEPWENVWRFKLTEALTPGGSAEAKLVLLRTGWGTGEDEEGTIENPTDILFEVYDPLYVAGRGAIDCVGYARRMADSGRFEIISMRSAATMITGLLTADLATTDTTFKIDGVTVMQPVGGELAEDDLDESDEATIYNVFAWEGDNNGRCFAIWNQAASRWEAFQVACPA